MIFHKTIFLIIAMAAAMFATGCPERRSIADIEANPGRYQNKEIAIAGTVRNGYGLSIPGTNIGGGAYQISDGTGSIWVITKGSIPAKGTEMGVSGVVGSGINIGGRNYGLGIMEKERRYKGH